MVRTGRWVIIIAMFMALIFTWSDVLGIGGEGGLRLFRNIQAS
jgi:SSS family solute:Na+ symporter